MDNKEIIKKLTDYYLTQDPKIVARALANCIIDIHRIVHYHELPESKAISLNARLLLNSASFDKFILEGCDEDMKLDDIGDSL